MLLTKMHLTKKYLQAFDNLDSLGEISFVGDLNDIPPDSLVILGENWGDIFHSTWTWRHWGFQRVQVGQGRNIIANPITDFILVTLEHVVQHAEHSIAIFTPSSGLSCRFLSIGQRRSSSSSNPLFLEDRGVWIFNLRFFRGNTFRSMVIEADPPERKRSRILSSPFVLEMPINSRAWFGVEQCWMVRDVIGLIFGNLWQRVISLEDRQRLAEEFQRLGLQQIERIWNSFHILTDRIPWEISFVQISTEVVQRLLAGRSSDTWTIYLGLQVRRFPNFRRNFRRTFFKRIVTLRILRKLLRNRPWDRQQPDEPQWRSSLEKFGILRYQACYSRDFRPASESRGSFIMSWWHAWTTSLCTTSCHSRIKKEGKCCHDDHVVHSN